MVATVSNVFQPVASWAGWHRSFDPFALLPRQPGRLRMRKAARLTLQCRPQSLPTTQCKQLCTTCSWWCRGRFFAERVDLHPQFGTGLAAIAAACCTPASFAQTVRSALASAVSTLRLRVVSWNSSVPVLDAVDNTL